ncbi:MAG: hypothetical protein ACRCT2_02035 [Plesiomonas shigelloides]
MNEQMRSSDKQACIVTEFNFRPRKTVVLLGVKLLLLSLTLKLYLGQGECAELGTSLSPEHTPRGSCRIMSLGEEPGWRRDA